MTRFILTVVVLGILSCAFLLTSILSAGSEVDEVDVVAPASSTVAFFDQEEIDNPDMWYAAAEPDHIVTLAAAPGNTIYSRLLAAIQAAPANSLTYIVIPFHINTGNFGVNETIVGVRPGATVVLIGNHPSADNGQSVISDTHNGSAISRTFRLRGSGGALVMRNIVLQKASVSGTVSSVPVIPPAPLDLSQQTASGRGGGIAVENGNVSGVANAGGGHLVLCSGTIIRNTSTNNNGPIDVQTNGRLTMMPGSLMHTNAAGNSGGAVHVGTNATFNMYGGIIKGNVARGENTASPTARAVGGAVFVQNGGTFNMYEGEIVQNRARLDEISAAPSATNAIVTSNGGAVFVTGSTSSFNMYGGNIHDNSSIRTRSSDLATGAMAVSSRNAYRAGNGGGVYLTSGATFTMNGGSIHNNIATNEGAVTNTATAVNALNLSNGGGVYLTGASTVFTMNGGTICDNSAVRTNNSVPTVATAQRPIFAGNGGGVHVFDGAQFVMTDGEICENRAMATGDVPSNHNTSVVHLSNGGGVFAAGTNSRVNLEGGAIEDNHGAGTVAAETSFSGNGGGVYISGAQLQIANTEIRRNIASSTSETSEARGNGGGVCVLQNGQMDMQSGIIAENWADDGGGLFVPHANLSNITVASPAVFSGNVARNGVRIDNGLAAAHQARINPGTVSLTWLEEIPLGSGNFVDAPAHAFTNLDINSAGPQFWRVTYEALEAAGQVGAKTSVNEFPVANGSFVPDGARLTFDASPVRLFQQWEIGTRANETDEAGNSIDFDFVSGGIDTPLSQAITAHTHVRGSFSEESLTTLSASKVVTGSFADRTQDFTFTLFLFEDAEGQFPLVESWKETLEYTITGAGIDVPVTGVFDFDSDGTTSFALKHGQFITIDAVPLFSYFRLVETEILPYEAFFVDSSNAGVVVSGNDTTLLSMSSERSVDFTNDWRGAPPTGISLGTSEVMPLLLLLLPLGIFAGLFFGLSRKSREIKSSYYSLSRRRLVANRPMASEVASASSDIARIVPHSAIFNGMKPKISRKDGV